MDLKRFVDLLASKRLCFPRLDQFGDPFEGSVPQRHYDGVDPDAWIVSMYPKYSIRGSDREQLSKQHKMCIYATYSSCWHLGSTESDLMWNGYGKGGDALAVVLAYESLAASMRFHNLMIGCVRYIDYETDDFPDYQWKTHAFMHKRCEFADEREVRIIYQPEGWAGRDGRKEIGPSDLDRVIFIPWNAEELLDRVVISPNADEVFKSAVERVIDAFAPKLRSRLEASRMCGKPVY